jgi:hypothetical protein
VWKLVDGIIIASLHVAICECNTKKFERIVGACKDILHEFGIHSSTLQVEYLPQMDLGDLEVNFFQPRDNNTRKGNQARAN